MRKCVLALSFRALAEYLRKWERKKKPKTSLLREKIKPNLRERQGGEKEWTLGCVYISCSDGLAPVLPQTSHSVTAWGREFSFLLKLVFVFRHNLEFASGKLFKCDSIHSRTNYSSTSESREREVFILGCIHTGYNTIVSRWNWDFVFVLSKLPGIFWSREMLKDIQT